MVARDIREFGAVRVHTTDWPIILLEFPEGRIADVELRDALGYIGELLRECVSRRERCAQVTDLTRIKQLPSASQRRIAGDWVKETMALQKVASVGGTNVTPSAILRGLITAIQWIQIPPTPVEYFATRNEAMLQAITWLAEAGMLLPPGLHALRDRLTLEAQRNNPPSRWSLRR